MSKSRLISASGQSEDAKPRRRSPHPPTSSHAHLHNRNLTNRAPPTTRAKSANMQPTFRRMAGHNHGSKSHTQDRPVASAMADKKHPVIHADPAIIKWASTFYPPTGTYDPMRFLLPRELHIWRGLKELWLGI